MISLREKNQQRLRRVARVRAKIQGSPERPRMAVHRSLAHISVQLIDDAAGKTLIGVRDLDVAETDRKGKNKKELAALVGKMVAEQAKTKGIAVVIFDRRDKRFHGRLKALADAARENGLKF